MPPSLYQLVEGRWNPHGRALLEWVRGSLQVPIKPTIRYVCRQPSKYDFILTLAMGPSPRTRGGGTAVDQDDGNEEKPPGPRSELPSSPGTQ